MFLDETRGNVLICMRMSFFLQRTPAAFAGYRSGVEKHHASVAPDAVEVIPLARSKLLHEDARVVARGSANRIHNDHVRLAFIHMGIFIRAAQSL